jgi:peptidylprolyl isomerase
VKDLFVRAPRTRLLGAATATILLLSACGSEGEDPAAQTTGDDAVATSVAPRGDLADLAVETSENDEGVAVPSITWSGSPFAEGDLPFATAETEVRELAAGEGEEATDQHHVVVKYLLVNGTTGEEVVSSFPTDETVLFDLTNTNLLPAIPAMLVGTQPGDKLLAAVPPAEGFGASGQPDRGIGANDTLVFYIEVVDVHTPLAQAEGEPVEPEEGLPEVEADGTTPAQVTVPDTDPPTELVAQPLVEGAGKEVEAGDQLTVHYTGVRWSDGSQFDSSLDRGQPFPVQIGAGQVIQGWDQGLVGQTVGSRVLLVIPPELGYGASEGHELQEETLVFVVDILDAD